MWLVLIPLVVSDLPGGQATSKPAGHGTQLVLGDGADGGSGECHSSHRLSTGAPPSLCCSHGGCRGPPGHPFSVGSLQSTPGRRSRLGLWTGQQPWPGCPGGSQRIWAAAPHAGTGGLKNCPRGGLRWTDSRQDAGGPGHTTLFFQTSVSPSIKWAIPW